VPVLPETFALLALLQLGALNRFNQLVVRVRGLSGVVDLIGGSDCLTVALLYRCRPGLACFIAAHSAASRHAALARYDIVKVAAMFATHPARMLAAMGAAHVSMVVLGMLPHVFSHGCLVAVRFHDFLLL
jgi:hypothetical protein